VVPTTEFTSITPSEPQCQCNVYIGVLAGALSVAVLIIVVILGILAVLIAKYRNIK